MMNRTNVHPVLAIAAVLELAGAACSDTGPNRSNQAATVADCSVLESSCVDVCTEAPMGVSDCASFCNTVIAECCEDRGTSDTGEPLVYFDNACAERHEALASPVVIDGTAQPCGLDEDCDGADDCNGSPSFACCGDGDCNGLDDCTYAPVQDPACPAPCGDADSDGFDDCATKIASGATPADMVRVPAGLADLGCDMSVTPYCPEEERTRDKVEISAFYIDRTEVSQAEYQACIDAGACSSPGGSFDPVGRAAHPVTDVTWDQAAAYCAWAGKRLPTDYEWEKAAAGPTGRTHPWGDGAPFGHVPPCTRANRAGCVSDTVAVGSYPDGASAYGALDMSGNVSEWVRDYVTTHSRYQTFYASAFLPRKDVVTRSPDTDYGDQRVYRGGDWFTGTYHLMTTTRRWGPPTMTAEWLGFRCARSGECMRDVACPADGLGQQCIATSDGCGGVMQCGPVSACTGFDTCGGGELAGVCGCDPAGGTCGPDWIDSYHRGTDTATLSAVASDAAGNVYFSGSYENHSFTNTRTAWHLSTTATGQIRFDRSYGGSCTNISGGFDIAVDDTEGAVYVAGGYSTGGFGGARATLHKYDTAGGVVWSKYLSAPFEFPDLRFYNVGVDGSGDVLVAGTYKCDADLGGGPLGPGCTSFVNYYGAFAKYRGSDGAHLWSVGLGEMFSGRSMPLVADSSNDMTVLVKSIDLGSGPSNRCDGFALVRVDGATGDVGVQRCFEDNIDNSDVCIDCIAVVDLAIDDADNIYVSGYFLGERDFGGIVETAGVDEDGDPIKEMFVAKLHPDLSAAHWVMRTHTSPTGATQGLNWQQPMVIDVELDAAGNVYGLANYYPSGGVSVDLDGNVITSGSQMLFALDGATGGVTGFGTYEQQWIDDFSVDETSGRFLLIGNPTAGPVEIGRRVVAGTPSAFVARVPQAEMLTGATGCVPKTCDQAGAECGTTDDGCGGTLDCGTCSAGLTCSSGVCYCSFSSCSGLECGISSSGCRPQDCGGCAGDLECGALGTANVCQDANCVPASCGASDCGAVGDGCGGTLDCGECPAVCGDGVCECSESPASCPADCEKTNGPGSGQFTCGDDTCEPAETATSCPADCTAEGCACEPTTCVAEGAQCGSISDGCGGVLSCGTCTSPDTCGGGGTPNVCGTSSCGNGVCDVGESCDGRDGTLACGADCPGVTSGNPANRYCYVNGVCEGSGCP